jgi:hypothetical protein
MRDCQFIHTATITPRSHTLSSKKKTTGKGTPVTNVPCRIESLSDSDSASVLGIATHSVYRGFWPGGTSINDHDLITWKTKIYQVTSTEEKRGREDEIDHIETLMTLSRRSA